MTSRERAIALRDVLLRNMTGRKGFRRDEIDAETVAEWDEEWLSIIAAALALGWTTEKPTVAGWYWYRLVPHSPFQELGPQTIGLVGPDDMFHCHRFRKRMGAMPDGEWAGPLLPPPDTRENG